MKATKNTDLPGVTNMFLLKVTLKKQKYLALLKVLLRFMFDFLWGFLSNS